MPHLSLGRLRRQFVVIIFIAAVASSVQARNADPVMFAHFINVGQSDCTLLEFPCGVVLIDAGAETSRYEDDLIAYLDKFFKRRTDLNRTISCLFITHQHKDHTKALRAIVDQFTVERYIENGERTGGGAKDTQWLEDEVAAGNQSTILRIVRDDEITALQDRDGLTDATIDPIKCDDCDPVIRVLSGGLDVNPGWPEGDFAHPNNHSLVIRIDFGESSFLFTGDLQEYAIDTLVEYYEDTESLDIDVYQVGHHASHNATTEGLLEQMTPQIAVISMGFWNDGRMPNGKARAMSAYGYGHPNHDILDLLADSIPGYRSHRITIRAGSGSKRFGEYEVRKRIYATGWNGTVKVRATLERQYITYTERVH